MSDTKASIHIAPVPSPSSTCPVPEHSSATEPEHDGSQDCGSCAPCRKAKHDRRMYRTRMLLATVLPFLLASLDLTVVATALPFIARHFGKTNQQTWIVTAYTLTSTAFIPAFGQLAEVFGRHDMLQLALGLMLVGSVMCAATSVWAVLILGRAVQGVAAAGFFSLILIVLADRVSLRENAKLNSFVQFFAGTAYCYGPVMGGYLTRASWRWCFIISIPISVTASVFLVLFVRKDLVKGKHSIWREPLAGLRSLDLVGTALFVASICLLILAVTWGGAAYKWSSAAVLVPLVIGALCLIAFPVWERSMEPGHTANRRLPRQSAMIPVSLFSRRDTIWLAIVQFASGAALYSVFYYLAIYYVLVEGSPPSKAGLDLLWYIAGISAGVVGASILCNVYPASTWVPLVLGTWAEALGMGLIAYGIHIQHKNILIGMTIISGFGTGVRSMPSNLMMTGVWPTKRAQGIALLRFTAPFGGTLALAIMGSVFNNKLADARGSFDLGSINPFSLFSGSSSSNVDVLAGLPPDVAAYIRSQAKYAVTWAFLSIMPILGLSCVTSLLLGNVWVKTKKAAVAQPEGSGTIAPQTEKSRTPGLQTESSGTPGPQAPDASYVLLEPYLFALLRGRQYLESKKMVWYPDEVPVSNANMIEEVKA